LKSVSSNERDYSFTELSILDQLRHCLPTDDKSFPSIRQWKICWVCRRKSLGGRNWVSGGASRT